MNKNIQCDSILHFEIQMCITQIPDFIAELHRKGLEYQIDHVAVEQNRFQLPHIFRNFRHIFVWMDKLWI